MNHLDKERVIANFLAAQLIEHVKNMLAESAKFPVGDYEVIVKPKK